MRIANVNERIQLCACRCISLKGILHICDYLTAASNSEYRFVTIVGE